MKETSYNKIVKISAWYDLLITAPFAFPVISEFYVNFLSTIHKTYGFAGEIPKFFPIHFLFMNLMGSIIIVWSILRIRHTKPILGLYDAYGRTLFSIWQSFYLLYYHASPIILFTLIPEVILGLIQYWGYWMYQKRTKLK